MSVIIGASICPSSDIENEKQALTKQINDAVDWVNNAHDAISMNDPYIYNGYGSLNFNERELRDAVAVSRWEYPVANVTINNKTGYALAIFGFSAPNASNFPSEICSLTKWYYLPYYRHVDEVPWSSLACTIIANNASATFKIPCCLSYRGTPALGNIRNDYFRTLPITMFVPEKFNQKLVPVATRVSEVMSWSHYKSYSTIGAQSSPHRSSCVLTGWFMSNMDAFRGPTPREKDFRPSTYYSISRNYIYQYDEDGNISDQYNARYDAEFDITMESPASGETTIIRDLWTDS